MKHMSRIHLIGKSPKVLIVNVKMWVSEVLQESYPLNSKSMKRQWILDQSLVPDTSAYTARYLLLLPMQ